MDFHTFFDGNQPGAAIAMAHEPALVLLSIAIACLASYSALNIAERISASEKNASTKAWLWAGAWSMGFGVWAMHFIGMLALKLPLRVSYDLLMTIASTIPAILAGAVMLSAIVNRRERQKRVLSFMVAGTLMGAGISAMHYAGMKAMRGVGHDLIMRFEPLLFRLSIVIGVVLASVALYIFFLIGSRRDGGDTWWMRIAAAMVMGFAISGMHYTGMASTFFFQGNANAGESQLAISPTSLAITISLVSVLLALLAIAVTVIDRRLKKAARAEQHSRSQMLEAIESIADGFSLYDMHDHLVVCNGRYRELMDTGSGLVPGMSFESIIRRVAKSGLLLDATGRADEWVNERLGRHRTPRAPFLEHWSGDRWFRISERRVWSLGTVAIYTDVTDLKRTEMELSKAIAEAQEASRAKSAFLANMSHELRTPMNAIIGYCEMLIEEMHDSESETCLQDLKKIHTASTHLLSLINDILDLSKIEAGKVDLYVEEFDIPLLIGEITTTIRPMIDKNSNRLRIDCPEGMPRMQSDLTKLRQALLNVLSNAAKFTRRGEIILSVKAECRGGGDWIEFRIADNGIGMAPEQLNEVFKAFTQADNSTTRKYGGTGLGLTITKKFCQMLGGDISVRSELKKGSTFVIEVPTWIKSSRIPVREASNGAVVLKKEDEAGGTKTILVVDGDPTAAATFLEIFESAGYNAVCAADGPEALRLAEQLQPLAVTLDVLRAHMDGWTVLARLKGNPTTRGIPIYPVALRDNRGVALSLKAADYLTKPVDRQQLVELVGTHERGSKDCPILVVDSDPGSRDTICRTLIGAGYSVLEAGNSQCAGVLLDECNPRLMILDLMMPVMDGFKVLRTLHEHSKWRTLPVLAVIARELTMEQRLKLQEGAKAMTTQSNLSCESFLEEIARSQRNDFQAGFVRGGEPVNG